MNAPTFVIAARKYKRDRKHYRTVYYRECVDGKPRMGAKCDAVWFTADTAVKVAAHLRTLAPRLNFRVLDVGTAPPRGVEEMGGPPEPVQLEMGAP